MADQRKDFAFKVAGSIVNKYEKIYVKDLKIANMLRNKHLFKSVYDAGWGMLKGYLTCASCASMSVSLHG